MIQEENFRGRGDSDESRRRRSRKRSWSGDFTLLGSTVAGKYRVLDVLGKGSFGTVYLVESLVGTAGQKLALKVLPEKFSHEPRNREQFINEVRLAMKLDSRYIVPIRDAGSTDDGLLYCAMDYFPGTTLTRTLRRRGTLEIRHALRLVRKVLRALETAHGAGVIHRDIKPANILIVGAGPKKSVRVLDLGIAREITELEEKPARWVGTPSYMPPEQFTGDALGFPTDLYAVGVVLYECVTGIRPYPGDTAREILEHFAFFRPEPPEKLRPEVASYAGLSRLMLKAIKLRPEDRFQTARQFIRAVQEVLAMERARYLTPPGKALSRARRARPSRRSSRRQEPLAALPATVIPDDDILPHVDEIPRARRRFPIEVVKRFFRLLRAAHGRDRND